MATDRIRYRLIDALRGLAILNMLAYHLCYDIFVVFGVDPDWFALTPVLIWERFICCTFILVSGVSMNFSEHPYRRGLLVNVCGMLITAATLLLMPSQRIIFGVLNLIGCAMLLCAALRPLLNRIRPLIGAAAGFMLFMLCYGVPNHFVGIFNLPLVRLPDLLYTTDLTAPLGLHTPDFFSADYFPLIPWVFLFLCGYFLWRCAVCRHADRLFVRRIPILDFIGRYSLWIYLIHQPVLYGVCALLFSVFGSH